MPGSCSPGVSAGSSGNIAKANGEDYEDFLFTHGWEGIDFDTHFAIQRIMNLICWLIVLILTIRYVYQQLEVTVLTGTVMTGHFALITAGGM